jgi:hypothetical protein
MQKMQEKYAENALHSGCDSLVLKTTAPRVKLSTRGASSVSIHGRPQNLRQILKILRPKVKTQRQTAIAHGLVRAQSEQDRHVRRAYETRKEFRSMTTKVREAATQTDTLADAGVDPAPRKRIKEPRDGNTRKTRELSDHGSLLTTVGRASGLTIIGGSVKATCSTLSNRVRARLRGAGYCLKSRRIF